MGKKDLDQFKRMIRAFAALFVIAATTLVFVAVWIKYYNIGIGNDLLIQKQWQSLPGKVLSGNIIQTGGLK